MQKSKSAIGIVRRQIHIIALLAILAALAWLLIDHRYTEFLHPRFQPFLLTGAVIVLGFIAALFFTRRRPAEGHPNESFIRSAVMVVPLLFMVTVAGQGMGTHALNRKYTGTEQELLASLMADAKETTASEELNRPLSLLDVVRKMKRLDGARIITEGLVYRDVNVPAGYLLLYRFAIFCCAADAIPVWVVVVKDDLAAFANESWVRIEGTFEVARMQGRDVPLLRAETVTQLETPPPGARYLYF
jgi:uncharacterized repeat protein (TIGR03943 family)